MSVKPFAPLLGLALWGGAAAGLEAAPAQVSVRSGGSEVVVGPGGVAVRSADGGPVVVGRDPAAADSADAPAPPPAEVADDAAFADGLGEDPAGGPPADGPPADADAALTADVPEWADDPPAGRILVVGPLETTPAAARAAAGRVAAGLLAERLDISEGVVNDAAVRHLTARSATQPITRTAGEHEFRVYRTRLLLNAEPDSTAHLVRLHRRAVADGRAGAAAGVVGALAGLFGVVWGVGRRKLGKGAAKS